MRRLQLVAVGLAMAAGGLATVRVTGIRETEQAGQPLRPVFLF